jgi:hypothetical protein
VHERRLVFGDRARHPQASYCIHDGCHGPGHVTHRGRAEQVNAEVARLKVATARFRLPISYFLVNEYRDPDRAKSLEPTSGKRSAFTESALEPGAGERPLNLHDDRQIEVGLPVPRRC